MGQVSGAMGNVFGSTNGLDASGNPLPKNASADQLGIGSGQLFARKALSGGLKGLSTGLGNMQMRQPSYSPPIQPPQQQMVDPAMFGMGRPKNPYFGG